MILRERVTIRATPESVWPWVADPIRVSQWNPKLIAIDRNAGGPLRLGERFREIYRMSGRDRESNCEVIELDAPYLLVVRHRLVDPADRFADECYRLQATSDGTRLIQEIDLARSGIAWLFQLLMWFLHTTGTPVGKRYLISLKELVERELSTE